MKLSVAYSFEPGMIERLSEFPEVYEIYGKMDRDVIGGGRSSYTLRDVTRRELKNRVRQAHEQGIEFNYLINGATLGGIEQTRKGQRQIRKLLDFIADTGVDSVTLAVPYLARLIRNYYPQLKIRVSAFAMVDAPLKAKSWEDLGIDTICVSGISCNRDFERLRLLRESVACDLQLIANASCFQNCIYESAHMNLLTESSRKGKSTFCLDYCVLHCSQRRLEDPANYIKSIWIRPEDLAIYEEIGYHNFKLVERSSPVDLMIKRVEAYARRHFDGNLLELVGPVAKITKEQKVTLRQRLKLVRAMLRPDKVKIRTLLKLDAYMKRVIPHDFSKEGGAVYIDNRKLDGFMEGFLNINCAPIYCPECRYCDKVAEKAVTINQEYNQKTLRLAAELDKGLVDGSLW